MARSFNGTTDFMAMDAAHLYSLNAAWSIATWIKVPTGGGGATFYGEGNSGTSTPQLQIQVQPSGTGKAILAAHGDAGTTQSTSLTTGVVSDNTWHHLVYTQDASANYKFYVDGATDATGSMTAAATTLNRATLGGLRRTGGLENPTAANFLHLATWNRQITAGEAASLGHGALPSLFAPNHYWPLWGADSPEPDLGTATHTVGTLTGSAFQPGPRAGISLFGLETPFDYSPGPPQTAVTGSVAVAITATITTAGVTTHHGSAAVTETVTVATAGAATHYGSSTVAETVTVTVSGEGFEHGTVAVTETVTVTVSGTTPVPPLEIVYSRVYGIELTLTDDGVEQVSRLVTSLDGF